MLVSIELKASHLIKKPTNDDFERPGEVWWQFWKPKPYKIPLGLKDHPDFVSASTDCCERSWDFFRCWAPLIGSNCKFFTVGCCRCNKGSCYSNEKIKKHLDFIKSSEFGKF